MAARDVLRRIGSRLEEATGFALVDVDHLRVTEATAVEARNLAFELEEFGYASMDFLGGRPNEPTAPARRRWAQQARVVWQADPQAGASVELLNEFTFGRGVPKPRAKEEVVQEVIDDFWDDPQNQRVLTSFTAQLKLGNSLSVQSNIFFLIFDEGDDGKLKLSFLNHDTVEQAVPDPDNRQRILYFTARKQRQEWDFAADRPKSMRVADGVVPKLLYYEVWGAVDEALEERGTQRQRGSDAAGVQESEIVEASAGEEEKVTVTKPTKERGWLVEAADDDEPLELAPRDRVGDGKVYHLAENTDMEQVFGVPRMRRTIRWYTAYNDYMKSRVDMMMAAAAFIMKRKVKGTPAAFEKMTQKAMRATSDLQTSVDEAVGRSPGPASAASVMQENQSVEHEPFNLDTRAGNALTDGQMLRAQVSAGDRFPQHYLGDVGSANLATATSMELPVLKHVEARQELIESLFRFCIDRAIDLAVEKGRLNPNEKPENPDDERVLLGVTGREDGAEVLETVDMLWRINGEQVVRETAIVAYADGAGIGYELCEAHEDKTQDESDTGLDLGYEFAMPSPLRRMMGDVVTATASVAQTFDPNNTNPELSRLLLAFVLAEAFEMPDAQDAVDKIFPPGYVPPELAAMQGGAGGAGAPQPNFFSPDATGLPSDPANAYGANKTATAPENVPMQQSAVVDEDAPRITVGRAGQPVYWPGRTRGAGSEEPMMQTRVNGRVRSLQQMFSDELRGETMDALAKLTMNRLVDTVTNVAASATNGNHE